MDIILLEVRRFDPVDAQPLQPIHLPMDQDVIHQYLAVLRLGADLVHFGLGRKCRSSESCVHRPLRDPDA